MAALRIVSFIAIALGAISPQARAGEIVGHLTDRGMALLEAEIPQQVSLHYDLPAFDNSWNLCPGSPIAASQHGNQLSLAIHDVGVRVPRPGTLRVEVVFDAHLAGILRVERAYACLGTMTCSDSMTATGVLGTLDFEVVPGPPGQPAALEMVDGALHTSPEELDFDFADCAPAGLLDVVVDFVEQQMFDQIVGFLEDMAVDALTPLLNTFLTNFTEIDVRLLTVEARAALQRGVFRSDGVSVVGDVDFRSIDEPGSCIEDDPGEPARRPGPFDAHAILSGVDFGVGVELSVVDELLYHVWRSGLACLSDADLAKLGLHIDTGLASALIPDVPGGTQFRFEVALGAPPRLEAQPDSALVLDVVVDDLVVTVVAERPDGIRHEVRLLVGVRARARVDIDAAANALALELGAVSLHRLELDDPDQVTQDGFDVVALQQIIETHIVPEVLGQLQGLPLSGPVLGQDGYYALLRRLVGTRTHVAAGFDLFIAPADDREAPETSLVSAPAGPVTLAEAQILVDGSDAAIPGELLRYRVEVDGVARPDSFVREIAVGEAGKTGTYTVRVAAVDLAGNVDPSPIEVTVDVDGIAPSVVIPGSGVLRPTGEALPLAWQLSDDRTPAAQLVSGIEIRRVLDRRDVLATEHVQTLMLEPGATTTTLELPDDELFRVRVFARDEAGNESAASVLVGSDDQGGCSAATRPGAHGLLALLLMAGYVASRRRRRGRSDGL